MSGNPAEDLANLSIKVAEEANANYKELAKTLVLIGSVVISFSGLLVTSEKVMFSGLGPLLIISMSLIFGSVVCGVADYYINYRFHGSISIKYRELQRQFVNGDVDVKSLNAEMLKIPYKTTEMLFWVQVILLGLGFIALITTCSFLLST